jgi:hypothetical protein
MIKKITIIHSIADEITYFTVKVYFLGLLIYIHEKPFIV